MTRRIMTAVLALLCTLTLFTAGIAPAHAYAPPSEGSVETQAEQFVWYYRKNHGVWEMRLWSITNGEWVTKWTPVPDGWVIPGV